MKGRKRRKRRAAGKEGKRKSIDKAQQIKRKRGGGKNTNTLPDLVLFSDPYFTASPANNPYNLTILRKRMDQSISPAIWRSEMKYIKAQV